jgi:hypothetical protein
VRGVGAGRILLRVSDHVLHIAIDIDRADEEIRGHMHDGVHAPKPFTGWLGLIGALDRMLGSPGHDMSLPRERRRGEDRVR